MSQFAYPISWGLIQECLQDVVEISGGFSSAFKGVVRLNDGREAFVKLAADEDRSKNFVDHEIKSYSFLAANNYSYMPNVLSVAPNNEGFAIEVLNEADGWDWPTQWSDSCLKQVLIAMDSLSAISHVTDTGEPFVGVRQVDSSKNGWSVIGSSTEMQDRLTDILNGRLDGNFIQRMAEKESKFKFRKDTLVHNDVRSYNCAWHEEFGAKLIDFDCLGAGDARIAYAFTLGDACGDGVDMSTYLSTRTDIDSLEWVAGYWLAQSFRDNLNPEDRENKIRRSAAVLDFLVKEELKHN